MRTLRDYILWPTLGLAVFWIGYGIALESAAPQSRYCVDTVGISLWPAIAYVPVSLIGSTASSWNYPRRRLVFVVAWNICVTAAVLFLSYGAAFAAVGPNNCGA